MTLLANHQNREMRTFHCELAHQVQAIHRSRCPCCNKVMVQPRRRNAVNSRRPDRISVAHDQPVGLGGDATIWVYACQGCNAEQGRLTFFAWAIVLQRNKDPRAVRVFALAGIIEAYRSANRGRQTSFPQRELDVPAAAE